VYACEDGENHALRDQADQHVADAHRQTGRCVLAFVEIAVHERAEDRLGHNQKNECRYRQLNEVRHEYLIRSMCKFYWS
jgi:hypothetical protein